MMDPAIARQAFEEQEQTMSAKVAYTIFHASYRASPAIPHWDDLPAWMKDALIALHTRRKD